MMASVECGPQDSSTEDLNLQRRGQRLPYQIFPDAAENCEVVEGPVGQRGRLPSIVVDPTQVSEEVRGGLLWPLQRQASVEEDDLSFQECLPQNTESDQSEQDSMEGSSGDERGLHIKYSSATVQPGLMDCSRLTPPQSPTTPEAAPPCFRG